MLVKNEITIIAGGMYAYHVLFWLCAGLRKFVSTGITTSKVRIILAMCRRLRWVRIRINRNSAVHDHRKAVGTTNISQRRESQWSMLRPVGSDRIIDSGMCQVTKISCC
jgi:hypothetical protein